MLIRRGVRLGALELERAQRGGGEVERGLGMAASPKPSSAQITPAAPT
jgi:hypothetical protein